MKCQVIEFEFCEESVKTGEEVNKSVLYESDTVTDAVNYYMDYLRDKEHFSIMMGNVTNGQNLQLTCFIKVIDTIGVYKTIPYVILIEVS